MNYDREVCGDSSVMMKCANLLLLFILAVLGLHYGAVHRLSSQDLWTQLWYARSQFLYQGSNLGPLHWEHRLFSPRPPGKSPSLDILMYNSFRNHLSWKDCCQVFADSRCGSVLFVGHFCFGWFAGRRSSIDRQSFH